MSVLTITKNNFKQEAAENQGLVLIDFWATWCGPCRMFSPVIDEIAEQGIEGLTVGKVNIDEEPELAEQFKVMTIPTVIILKNGTPAASAVGVQSKKAVLQMIENAKK